MNKTIAIIKGDGIGPEIVTEAMGVLDAVAAKFGHTFTYVDAPMGGNAIDKFGVPLPDSSLVTCRNADSVLLGAMGVTYLLLSTVFRGGARHDGGELLRVRLTRGGKTVTLRLLYDSGNLLTDPLTGESVPVIGQSALRALLPEREEGYITLSCTTAGGSGVLRAFYCDSVRVNGRDLGRRLVAVSPDIYGDSGFQPVRSAILSTALSTD